MKGMALDAFTREMISQGMFNEDQTAALLEESGLSAPCSDQACERMDEEKEGKL